MPSTATVTGTIGAGLTITAGVFQGVTSFQVDTEKRMLILTQDNGKTTEVSIAAATTMTVVIAAAGFTITIS